MFKGTFYNGFHEVQSKTYEVNLMLCRACGHLDTQHHEDTTAVPVSRPTERDFCRPYRIALIDFSHWSGLISSSPSMGSSIYTCICTLSLIHI